MDHMGSKGPFRFLNLVLLASPSWAQPTKPAADLHSDHACPPLLPTPQRLHGALGAPQGPGWEARDLPPFHISAQRQPAQRHPRGAPSHAWTTGPTTPAPRTPLSLRHVHGRPSFLRPQRATHTCHAQGRENRRGSSQGTGRTGRWAGREEGPGCRSTRSKKCRFFTFRAQACLQQAAPSAAGTALRSEDTKLPCACYQRVRSPGG